MFPSDATSSLVLSDETATLRVILDSTLEGIVVINEQGIVQFVNPAAEKMFRFTTEQIVGRSIHDLIPSPHNTAHDDFIAKHLASGQSLIIGSQREIDGKRSDGTPFPMYLSVSELVLSNGSRLIIGVMQDISKQKQAEQKIRDDAKRMRAILDTAVEGIVTINEQGIIEVFNRAAETIFHYTAEEVVGHNVRLLMPSPFREEHDSYITRYRTTGEKKIIGIGREVVGQRKDGSTFPMELSLSEVRLNKKQAATVLSVSTRIVEALEKRGDITSVQIPPCFPKSNPTAKSRRGPQPMKRYPWKVLQAYVKKLQSDSFSSTSDQPAPSSSNQPEKLSQ